MIKCITQFSNPRPKEKEDSQNMMDGSFGIPKEMPEGASK